MLKKIALALVLAASALIGVPGSASAAAYEVSVVKSNTYGWYTCRIVVANNRQYLDYYCTVRDDECDDHGVYVSIKVDLGDRVVDEGAWDRKTNNAGGCSHSSSKNGRIDSGIGSRDINRVHFVLTRDDRPGYDDYYSNTEVTKNIPYA